MNRLRHGFCVAAGLASALLMTLALPAQTRPPAPPASYKLLRFPPLRPLEIPKVETVTLPNGLRLLLLEDHELPLVSGSALIRTGNLFDPRDKIGLADVFGQVMRTGGTTTRTGEQLDDTLEAMAASVETGVDEDLGWANFSCLKENLPRVLGIFADVLMHPAFRQDKIELAKVQEKGAIARRNDDAAGQASQQFHDLIYGKSTPYGWEPEYATVDAIQRSDLEAFYQRYYFPNNVMLAVWGDFSAPAMKQRLEQAFAAWPRRDESVPAFPAVQADFRPGLYTVDRGDVDQTNIRIGQLGGRLDAPDYPALAVMSEILGGGFASRLFKDVRTKLGLAYSVGGGWGADYDHPGLFEISASTKSASTVEAMRAIMAQVRALQSAEVGEQEIATAKSEVLNSFVFAFDTRAKTVNRLLRYDYFGYPSDFIFKYRDALEKVTRADVLRVARKYLHPDRFAYVVVGNEKQYGQSLAALGLPATVLDTTIPGEPAPAAAPASAAEVAAGDAALAKARAAMGGAALATIKDETIVAQRTVRSPQGEFVIHGTTELVPPHAVRQSMQLPFGTLTIYTDGDSGWMQTPQGIQPIPAAQLQQVKGQFLRDTVQTLLHYRDPGYSARLLKHEPVKGRTADVVEVSARGQSFDLLIDAQSGLVLGKQFRSSAGGPPAEFVEYDSDYRAVDGVQCPFSSQTLRDGKPFSETKVLDIKINTGLTTAGLAKKPQ